MYFDRTVYGITHEPHTTGVEPISTNLRILASATESQDLNGSGTSCLTRIIYESTISSRVRTTQMALAHHVLILEHNT